MGAQVWKSEVIWLFLGSRWADRPVLTNEKKEICLLEWLLYYKVPWQKKKKHTEFCARDETKTSVGGIEVTSFSCHLSNWRFSNWYEVLWKALSNFGWKRNDGKVSCHIHTLVINLEFLFFLKLRKLLIVSWLIQGGHRFLLKDCG